MSSKRSKSKKKSNRWNVILRIFIIGCLKSFNILLLQFIQVLNELQDSIIPTFYILSSLSEYHNLLNLINLGIELQVFSNLLGL